MKKFLFIMLSMFMAITVNAQEIETAVKSSKVTDNVFVGASVGGTWSLLNHDTHDAFWSNINPIGTVKVGKYFTPNVGAQVSFEMGAGEGAKTLIDHTNLTVDGLLNFSNLFGRYKGEPRRFEVVGVLGVGWFHTYGYVSNSASAKAAVELNYNLGKSKAWQLNLVPSFTYLPAKAIDNSYVGLSVGVTYKFKNSNKKHHFTYVNVVSDDELTRMNNEVNELRSEKAQFQKQIAELNSRGPVIVHDTVYINTQSVNLDNVVSFAINDAKVTETQMANLNNIATVMKNNEKITVVVKAFADKETGTAEYNHDLSVARAEAVKKVLVDKFGIDEKRIKAVGLGDTEQPYNENNWNRVAVFVQE